MRGGLSLLAGIMRVASAMRASRKKVSGRVNLKCLISGAVQMGAIDLELHVDQVFGRLAKLTLDRFQIKSASQF